MSDASKPGDEPHGLISRRPPKEEREKALEGAVDPFMVGLRDDVQQGWFNFDTRQLAPGFLISPDDVVADIGCGEGGGASFCVRCGAHTILIDSDAEVLDRAVRDAAAAGPGKAEGRLGDAQSIPLPDAFATRVVCTEVLEHVDDPASTLRELIRVGKPGALFLITVPGAASERMQKAVAPAYYFEKPNHIRIFEAEDLMRLVEDAGLVIEKQFSFGFFWTMYWLFFHQAGIAFGRGSHPLLDAWAETWDEVLKSRQAPEIRAALNGLAPRSIGLVARKPG